MNRCKQLHQQMLAALQAVERDEKAGAGYDPSRLSVETMLKVTDAIKTAQNVATT